MSLRTCAFFKSIKTILYCFSCIHYKLSIATHNYFLKSFGWIIDYRITHLFAIFWVCTVLCYIWTVTNWLPARCSISSWRGSKAVGRTTKRGREREKRTAWKSTSERKSCLEDSPFGTGKQSRNSTL